ncbi:MAG: dUTP diphosphatase [Bdellovibrionota bacterium]
MIDLNSVNIKRLSEDATLPTRAHPDDAGLDLYCCEDIVLLSGQGVLARTGVAIALPAGFAGMVADRSSLAKRGIKTAGGIIDAGYRGEIQIVLWNISTTRVDFRKKERIAQLLIIPVATPFVEEVKVLNDTSRGVDGFGSTGK